MIVSSIILVFQADTWSAFDLLIITRLGVKTLLGHYHKISSKTSRVWPIYWFVWNNAIWIIFGGLKRVRK